MRNGITHLPRSSISGGFGFDSTVIQGDWTSQLTFVRGCLKGRKVMRSIAQDELYET